jgi:DNA mismatch repair protein MutS
VEIAEEGSDLVFLYKISPGSAEKSYGVYAAKLAGLPRPVVRRAEELLREYEAQGGERPFHGESATKQTAQLPSRERESKIIQALMGLDPDALAPVEALMKLFELRRMAEEGEDEAGKVRAIRTA